MTSRILGPYLRWGNFQRNNYLGYNCKIVDIFCQQDKLIMHKYIVYFFKIISIGNYGRNTIENCYYRRYLFDYYAYVL